MTSPSGLFSSFTSFLSDIRSWLSRIASSPKTFIFFGLIALLVFLFLLADTPETGLMWAGTALGVFLVLWLLFFIIRRARSRKANDQLGDVLEKQAQTGKSTSRGDVQALRERMSQAVRTIKTSKIGQLSGNQALYELPWYIVIGNPAAGKSSAVINSGLQFPFADKNGAAVRGVGGTRNCDWFFTTEGILLDTAGRYSVHEEDRDEWLGFLDLLKKHRTRAPINGIIVAASIDELSASGPEFAIELAKNLRQRVQELIDRLEVFAPVYIIFTKADLISGFDEFFADSDERERNRVWGATLPYGAEESRDVLSLFDTRFDELYEGLKEMGTAQISLRRSGDLPPGLLTFPLEFASIKPALRTFLSTLFETNPFQYKPIFRGFYFTSALQEGVARSTSTDKLAERFALTASRRETTQHVSSHNGYFLRDLFSNVIFSDKKLVRQHASPGKVRMRYLGFFGLVLVLGLVLGGWTWSYMGNRQLASNVQADMDKVVRMQQEGSDLQSRLEAMQILQDRIEQLDRYATSRPVSLGLGLYQGDELRHRLLQEYYAGLNQIMLMPVKGSLEDYLARVGSFGTPANANGQPAARPVPVAAAAPDTLFQDSSPTNPQDAYNALKTYLMMSNREHVDPTHLSDQITRFWRGWLETNRGTMPRDALIRNAERMISFYASRSSDTEWPRINLNLALVERTRGNLRTVMQGMPARERAYATIKARAATRFQTMTVARIVGNQDNVVMAGSYAIPGTFTREAWEQYVQPAIREASSKELQTTDWVLGVNARDDLTLEGSPEQIQKSLDTMYKTEYAEEWKKFLGGVSIQPFTSFSQAVDAMNRLGDPQTSPIAKLINTAYDQTSWDNPSLISTGLQQTQTGVVAWFKREVLRQSTAPQVKENPNNTLPMGPVGREFSDVARLVVAHENQSLLGNYMAALSKIRTRFNTLNNQGDPGPGALVLMRQTLEGKESELADALKIVDEQMLAGLTDTQRETLRPLLVRPLVQAYAVTLQPAERELNKVWTAQIYQPFNQDLAEKYPFSPNATVEASSQEIGQIFGPQGAIAKFVSDTLSPLTVRRGDVLTARTWGDLGVNLLPTFTANFSQWVAPLSGAAAGGGAAAQPQTLFQIQPKPAQGVTEYTIEIDGQQLRYRNTPPQWVNFVWPNAQGAPGARITATAFDGSVVEVVNEPGRYGLEKLIGSAQRTSNPDGSFNMTWSKAGVSVPVTLRIISNAQAAGSGASEPSSGQGLRNLRLPQAVVAPTPANVADNRVAAPAPAPARTGGK
ncbi:MULTISPECIES: type VI secretion system membrane subunit TssM [unclassified Achromobacter]|uniref:type VI secretion system membrane subunit TssM n=1 Tax=unclassified Achromobacter TaxID=2626865 RepID=UPI000B5188BF|nr:MULTISPECIES: type VI secretion system membrane subunit TssM [unclassified Achromobacter]OWT69110.1 type VI secretion protein VasK [Achromobacter sp. HZ34]OWT70515.1 type VI secretion protein VasK [Achromobacter sp. HZ28]